jgi:hypothetical protein
MAAVIAACRDFFGGFCAARQKKYKINNDLKWLRMEE